MGIALEKYKERIEKNAIYFKEPRLRSDLKLKLVNKSKFISDDIFNEGTRVNWQRIKSLYPAKSGILTGKFYKYHKGNKIWAEIYVLAKDGIKDYYLIAIEDIWEDR